MSLAISGKVVKLLEIQSGVSNHTGKEWKKQNFVIETMDSQYPKQICFMVWGDSIAMIENLTSGQEVEVKFDVESREYNGKWYTDVKAYGINVLGNTNASDAFVADAPKAEDAALNDDSDDDLPF